MTGIRWVTLSSFRSPPTYEDSIRCDCTKQRLAVEKRKNCAEPFVSDVCLCVRACVCVFGTPSPRRQIAVLQARCRTPLAVSAAEAAAAAPVASLLEPLLEMKTDLASSRLDATRRKSTTATRHETRRRGTTATF